MLRSSILLFAASILCFACSPPSRGSITPQGYEHSNYPLVVNADANGTLLPEGWKLDNYYQKPSRPGYKSTLEAKDSDDYKVTYQFDLDDDGAFDYQREEYAYDLRFTHLNHDGTIFLRTIPLSTDQGSKHLNVLLKRYAEASAGAGYEIVELTDTSSMLIEKRYAVGITGTSEATLAGTQALAAHLEVANLDQIKIDANARKEQVELVIAHTTFLFDAMPTNRQAKKKFPLLLLAGYANQPEHFKEGLKDFRDFLARMKIGEKSGFTLLDESQLENVEKEGDASSASEQENPASNVESATAEPSAPASENQEAQATPSPPAALDSETPNAVNTAPAGRSTPAVRSEE